MKAKAKRVAWVCTACMATYTSRGWPGAACRSCGRASTSIIDIGDARSRGLPLPMSLAAPAEDARKVRRWPLGIPGVDRVLLGGATRGTVALVAAPAGAGKSTLMLGSSRTLAARGRRFLYCKCESGDAALEDLATRLKVPRDRVWMLPTPTLDDLRSHVERVAPHVLCVDSLNGLADSSGRPLVAVTKEASEIAHAADCAAFFSVHLSKSQDISGPEQVKNYCDLIAWLDSPNGPEAPQRVFRTTKSRVAPPGRAPLLMTAEGLVDDKGPKEAAPLRTLGIGCAWGVSYDGKAARVVEVQTLVSSSTSAARRLNVTGVSRERVSFICAVLHQREGIDLGASDITINADTEGPAGDTGLDAAIAAALISSHRSAPLTESTCYYSELGVGAELRACRGADERLAEAQRAKLRAVGKVGDRLLHAIDRAHLRAV